MNYENKEINSPADQAAHEVIGLINQHIIALRDAKNDDSAWRFQYILYTILRERMETKI